MADGRHFEKKKSKSRHISGMVHGMFYAFNVILTFATISFKQTTKKWHTHGPIIEP